MGRENIGSCSCCDCQGCCGYGEGGEEFPCFVLTLGCDMYQGGSGTPYSGTTFPAGSDLIMNSECVEDPPFALPPTTCPGFGSSHCVNDPLDVFDLPSSPITTAPAMVEPCVGTGATTAGLCPISVAFCCGIPDPGGEQVRTVIVFSNTPFCKQFYGEEGGPSSVYWPIRENAIKVHSCKPLLIEIYGINGAPSHFIHE